MSTKPVVQPECNTVHKNVLFGYRLWAACTLILMSLLVAFSPNELKYDERYHIGLVDLVVKDGWVDALNSKDNQSAAGPLFAAFQIALKPLTNLNAPAIRWLNLVMIVSVVVANWLHLRGTSKYPFEASVSILGVTFLWPTVGLALTEIPALLAFTAFYILMTKSMNSERPEVGAALAVGAGLALGISILGRQTYLIVTPVVCLCMVFLAEHRMRFAIATVVAILTCSWLFIMWRGLVPESQQHVSGAFKFTHAILGLSYMGFASFILNPMSFSKDFFRRIPAVFVVSAILAISLFSNTQTPGAGVVMRITPVSLQPIVTMAIKMLLVSVGVMWLWNAVIMLWKSLLQKHLFFETLTSIFIAIAPGKVSHLFSSRYVVGGLSIESSRHGSVFKPSYLHLLLLVCSSVGGAITLVAYYKSS